MGNGYHACNKTSVWGLRITLSNAKIMVMKYIYRQNNDQECQNEGSKWWKPYFIKYVIENYTRKQEKNEERHQ